MCDQTEQVKICPGIEPSHADASKKNDNKYFDEELSFCLLCLWFNVPFAV